ncbi:unnamed protein product [Dracunculus medinensis]|uniref:SCP domain-containing protein n=1 Tax=Dracunculus medinensis TaxID=318479 RepID=A0A0N4UQM9_DRAME|nr:unnamed protein product [Dracunculus medinensis]
MSDTPRGACNMVQIGCGETVAIFENRMSQGPISCPGLQPRDRISFLLEETVRQSKGFDSTDKLHINFKNWSCNLEKMAITATKRCLIRTYTINKGLRQSVYARLSYYGPGSSASLISLSARIEDWIATTEFACAKKKCRHKSHKTDLTFCFYKLKQKSKEKETPQNVTKISVFDKIFSDQTPHFNSFDTTLPVKSYSTLSVKSSKPLQVLMTKARGITQMETVVSAYQPIMTEEDSTYKPTTMEAVSELSHETTILATDIMQLSTGCAKSNITTKVQKRVLARHKTYSATLAYVIAKMRGNLPEKTRELKWNCSLANSAQLWANECVWSHSESAFENKIGESLMNFWINDTSLPDSILMDATDAWWSNVVHKDYAGESSKNFVQNFDFFIQMTNLIATDMGCGMALCPVGGYHEKIQLVVCQYYPLDSSLAEKIRKFLTENRVRFLELAREYS